MDPFTQFLIGMTMQVIGMMLQPKPPKPKAETYEDFEQPTAESRPINVIFGTVLITGPNCVWRNEGYPERREIKIPTGKK